MTIFSTIITILPFIESTSQENSADQTARLRAVSILNNSTLNNNHPRDKQIIAYEVLQDIDNIRQLYNNNQKQSPEANLAMALVHYNNDTNYADYIKNMLHFLKRAHLYLAFSQSANPDLSKRIWFTKRLLSLETSPSPTQWVEDLKCTQMDSSQVSPNMCTYSEFKQIKEDREKLVQNGILSDFYNNEGKVHALRDGIDTFVFDLNQFIIISFIVGPVTFVAGIRFYFKRTETLKGEVK